ncbi:nucleolar complex protein 14 [Ceratobasidium sp. 423]|nr:nucleolar complex protein 14 [Ceratobasidium sp. 423]
MVKTSQLKQLKSALSSAGLSRNSQPQKHKKKKSRDGTAIEKAKKAAKLEAIQRRLNPFDERVTRVKHDVGGRKLKGVMGRPGVSRQAGLEQRKKTLLVEYDQKDRAGGIVDRRFGENDATMAPEERMLERFTRERQRQAKGTAFNLEDDEELTHYGQSLNALDDFDGAGIELDDDEESELAREAAETLEKAEKARLRRMRGEESEDEDERGGKRRRRVAQADDLEDDFVDDDDAYGLGAGLEGIVDEDDGSRESEEEETEGEGETEESGEENDEGGVSEEVDLSDLSDGAGEEDEPVEGEVEALVTSHSRPSKSKGRGKPVPKPTLPFTFPFPASHEELLEILGDVREEDVPTVIQRIRVQYHPSLAEGNKQKLQSLVGTLLDHTLHATSSPTPSFALVTSLTPHIYALSSAYPTTAAEAFISKLTLMQKNLARGLAHGASSAEARTWPGAPELALLRLVGVIWSTSDLNHAVGTPAMLLIGQYLAQARVRNLRDIASGLFLCTLVLQYESYSKRFVPEAVNFLANSCLYLAPHKFTSTSLPGWFPAASLESLSGLKLKSSSKLTPNTPNLSTLLNIEGNGEPQDKLDLLALVFMLLTKFAQMYASLSGFVELFEPVKRVLEGLGMGKQSPELQKRHSSIVDALSRTLKHSLSARKPLKLQAHKPIPIATYVPQFDAQYSGRRPHDPDHERAASAKLRAEYRKERKGALRELRKDNKFLAAEKAKRQEGIDTAYRQRMAKVVGEMHTERAEQKQMEREKKREKKRAGRK